MNQSLAALTPINAPRHNPWHPSTMQWLTLHAVIGILLCSCSPRPDSAGPDERRFSTRGILRSIGFAEKTVTVEHEDIPGFMPAMTMPFNVKSMNELEPLRAGDAISFDLVVKGRESWIEGIKKIAPGELRLPDSKQKATEAGKTHERLKEGDRMPDFHLIGETGQPISRATFGGKPLVLTFIFTRCPLPDYCPLMIDNFRDVRAALANDPVARENVQFLSISLDPEYDTPQVLAEYARRVAPDRTNWRFATGAPEEVAKLAAAFSVRTQREMGTISHGLCTAVIRPDGIIDRIFRGNGWKPAELTEALQRMKETPNQ
jgi:protein SCO1/2